MTPEECADAIQERMRQFGMLAFTPWQEEVLQASYLGIPVYGNRAVPEDTAYVLGANKLVVHLYEAVTAPDEVECSRLHDGERCPVCRAEV